MIRLIGTGQMAHDQGRGLRHHDRCYGRPFRPLHPQTVHARVELDAKGLTWERFKLACQLVERVDHRDQIKLKDRVGVARHMPTEHVYQRIGANGLTDLCAFFDRGDKEPICTCSLERGGNAVGRKPVAVCFDDCARFSVRHRSQGTPVRNQRIQINM